MLSNCNTLPFSRSCDVVPASIDIALTLISKPDTWVLPMLAL